MTVFHNMAVLNLNGGDGDDLFTVRAFALKGSTDSERARTDMKGDGGADTILYVVNAPVDIDGGDGFDTVRIIGTEFADDFVSHGCRHLRRRPQRQLRQHREAGGGRRGGR